MIGKGMALKHAPLERLMHYHHFLSGRAKEGGSETVTSTEVAELVHMDDTLVRKDLAAIGVRGYPRVGFRADDILKAIRDVLGFDHTFRAIIIGAGRLGTAMAHYQGFTPFGVEVLGLFDSAPQKTGLSVGRFQVQPMAGLPLFVRNRGVEIAILTVPATAAQEVANVAVSAGVKAIWDFATTSLKVPSGVLVRHEHISVGIAELSYYLSHGQEA